uniref:Sodium-dependent phosphate transport protein 2B n=1 Tax=Strigamia maritima TaxID=126957 RepID=T1JLV9_STRMM
MAGYLPETKTDLSMVSPATSQADFDPWALPEFIDTSVKWSELDRNSKIRRIVITTIKIMALVGLLYLFICSLDFLASAFKLCGGKTAGEVFKNNEHLKNPVVGLMIGVLATVLVQSSSTSTSIVVTMVASSLLDVSTAIPIVMGANIGTSVTNTFVSLAQSGDRNEFRRAFAGATVHDMFNWLSVIVLLPLEVTTGYLYHLTSLIVESFEWSTQKQANKELLTVLTKPFTSLIVQLDSKVIKGIAVGEAKYQNSSLLKEWCKSEVRQEFVNETINGTVHSVLRNESYGIDKCSYLLNPSLGLSDVIVGVILLFISIIVLCTCLICMVKILHSMLRGQIAVVIKKTINADFPGKFAFLTGYLAIVVGCGMTILVQSSSIFTSALTPLVGIGVISLDRMYPLTLGSNIGTTTTGILASLTASGIELKHSIQIALCHLFFNISGILLFYPIPFMRWPVRMAQALGNTTAKYRWFSIVYLIFSFFIIPGVVFLISMGGPTIMMATGIPIFLFFAFVILFNVLQRKCPRVLPPVLRNWNFLPQCCHSLKPWDRIITRATGGCKKVCPCCKSKEGDIMDNANNQYHSKTAIMNGSTYTLKSNPVDTEGQGHTNPVATSAV